jgi:hypothetical protein
MSGKPSSLLLRAATILYRARLEANMWRAEHGISGHIMRPQVYGASDMLRRAHHTSLCGHVSAPRAPFTGINSVRSASSLTSGPIAHSHSLQLGPPLLCRRSRLLPKGGTNIHAALTYGQSTSAAEEEDETTGELHAVDTAIRANALIFAAKLAVYFVSSSR